jgi:Superinfection immunity protein
MMDPNWIRLLAGLVMVHIVVVFFVYFVPTFIALMRDKRSKGAIIALNILAGWTGIGWLIALIWSLTSDQPQAQQVVYVQQANAAQDRWSDRRLERAGHDDSDRWPRTGPMGL